MCIYVCVVWTYVCACIHTHMCACVSTYIYTFICIYVSVHIYRYMYTYYMGFPGSSAGRTHQQHRRLQFNFWVAKIPWRKDRLHTPVFLGFPGGLDGKDSACNAGELDSIHWLGRSPGGGHGNLLQYSCLGSPHGQRSLGGYSPWVTKRHNRVTRHTAFILYI